MVTHSTAVPPICESELDIPLPSIDRQQPATTEDKLASILPFVATTDTNRKREATPQEQPRVESSPTSRTVSQIVTNNQIPCESPSTVSSVVSTIASTILTTATAS
ncbi:hypothetical protein AHF37_08209 [Paragonimus kellicotti]|nr:hypothetical protein AHF37_08209 [Paragonimus kellicotti]